MCGIAGIWGAEIGPEAWEERLKRMAGTLTHRGPDDEGIWFDPGAGIGLAHRRLAIIDLSSEGHQPMFSESGRFAIVYNGEVYNFPELRKDLEPRGHHFRGHSDTEVILAAVEEWGLPGALARLVGMFAFALWDRKERALYLVRDRLGIKPLYYGWEGGAFIFGSELKALKTFPGFQGEIDREALALYLRHNYIPSPFSIYRKVKKLLPGCFLKVSSRMENDQAEPQPFWSAGRVAQAGISDPFRGTDSEGVEQLEILLKDSVKLRMISDVPLGAFLSGGIDSSTVVSLMQAQSGRPVKTFTIGFLEGGYNEAERAREVARHLGTDHTELYVTPREALAVIPRLPVLYDEPFSDSSQIPTFLVSELARREVTVSLSGDGGDELFGGYNRYAWGRNIWKAVGWCPPRIRAGLARILTILNPARWDQILTPLNPIFRKEFPDGRIGDKVHKLAEIITVRDFPSLYKLLLSHWTDPSAVVNGPGEPGDYRPEAGPAGRFDNLNYQMMFRDTIGYLPDDILTKLDRASMGVSLEARVPVLDHRVVEFAWRLPLNLKIRKGKGKWILRKILSKYVPTELFERPKMGFGVPIDSWLRGPLRDWAEDLLGENRLVKEGFFSPGPIREKWQEHVSGRCNWQYLLWDVLMFQAWLETNGKPG